MPHITKPINDTKDKHIFIILYIAMEKRKPIRHIDGSHKSAQFHVHS